MNGWTDLDRPLLLLRLLRGGLIWGVRRRQRSSKNAAARDIRQGVKSLALRDIRHHGERIGSRFERRFEGHSFVVFDLGGRRARRGKAGNRRHEGAIAMATR